MKIEIDPWELKFNPFDSLGRKWMILCSGDYYNNDYNMMLVAWGSFGVMWHKPFVHLVVRPQRYTNDFLQRFDNFSLSMFPDNFRGDIKKMGTLSGRDFDKKNFEKLTAEKADLISSPVFSESILSFECRKQYSQPMDSQVIPQEIKESIYPGNDYHISYYGEILKVKIIKGLV